MELTGRPKPTKAETKESLERLVKQGVIELGEHNPDTELRRITILPSIMRVVNSRFLDELEQLSPNAETFSAEEPSADKSNTEEFNTEAFNETKESQAKEPNTDALAVNTTTSEKANDE